MRMLSVLVLVFVVLGGCGKNNEPPPETTGVPNAKQESGPGKRHGPSNVNAAEQASKMYETVCAMCHGMSGMGDGQAAATLNPKPRNYTDAAWQASVTDEEIKKTIMLGGQATGKSAAMPAWSSQLKDQPEVLDGLVQIIRGFKKGDAPPAGSAASAGSAAGAGSASK
jgi:mono/diheme cytochrome c family protein